MIYCSTGAQESDPMDNVCESGYNASVYNGPLLYEDSLAFRSHTLRNVWYTFVLSGAGKATLSVKHFSGTTPLMNVYQSDVDGAISFSELQQNGGIDSTETDGLVLLDNNFVRCNRSREQSVSFIRSGCQTAPNRYYVVLTEWQDTEPNQQVALDIKYEGEAVPPTRFDHYHTANVINGLEQTTAPYEPALLADGEYQGTPMSFQCASRDFGDPIDNACYDRSVWYKFETAVSGQARIAFENVNSGDKGRSEYMRLYRETIPGDSTSLVEVPLKNFNRSNSLNDTGHDWKEGCFSPGAYYLFWYTCNDAFDIFETYRPLLWLFQNEGDFCATAIPFNLDGIGTADASLRVDCHTIGEGFGEDGSNMGCLFGPEDYKSSWFKLSLTGEDKVDVTFNLKENTSVFPDQIRYRILYGTCTAITSGPCNTDANTVFTLNCMTEGDYFIQVVTPAGATGTLDISVSSLVTPEEFCQPLLPLEPNANFTYENDCESDTIFFQNKSSAGADISYLWEFPDGSTSTEINPTYLHPRIDTFQTITVNLQVINTALNLVDSVRIPVFILPTLNIFSDTPALACNGDTSTLDVSYPNATYLWQDGSTAPNFSYSDPGLYWVEVMVFGCTIRDSVIAIEKNCIFNTLDIRVCENVEYKGDLYQNDTSFIEIFPIEATIDSIVTTNISVLRAVRVERDTAICEGENIQVGTSIYATTDTYTDIFQTSEQCDSTVITNLMVYPKSQLDIQGVQAFCAGDSISLSVADQYTNYQWSTNGTSSKIEITQGGDYTLMVIDTNGCQATQSITVPDPIVLTSSIRATSDYNRFNISCNGLADGRAEVTVDNGQAPYTFQWNDGQSNAIANALAAASYTVSISDALGCTTENAITLNEPPVLAPDLMPFPVRCFGEKNGAVSVEIAGPTAPYEFSFNESSFTNNNYFENLPAGTYPIVLKDINACEWSGNIVVDEPELLRLNITPDYKEIFLGDSIEMNILTNAREIATIEWSPKSYMRCDTCITITTRPLTSVTYTARLVDSAGCVATNEASLLVQKDDRVFIPTAFSPNNDGENDRFTIFTGPNVERIHSLIIVNRWGELLFERYDFQPNDTSLGWDGKHKGQLLNPAVFIYYAEVEFYGGEMGEYKGTVTLIEN